MGGRGGNGGQGPNKTAKSQQGHDILMFLRGYVFGGFDTARWRVEERRRGRGATAAVQGGLKVGGEYIYIYIFLLGRFCRLIESNSRRPWAPEREPTFFSDQRLEGILAVCDTNSSGGTRWLRKGQREKVCPYLLGMHAVAVGTTRPTFSLGYVSSMI